LDRLKGKVAVVTGAGRMGNIGVAICEAFLREGAAGVVGTDLRTEESDRIQAHFDGKGLGRFLFVQQDVTSEADWARLVEQVSKEFGQLDVLVNNAGIALGGGVIDTTLESFRRSMAINAESVFLGTKHCAPLLETAVSRHPGGGSIVNTVSMGSYSPDPHHIGYSVSKAAARMITLGAAVEFGPRKIRVNSVHPGMTMTPMLREGFEHYIERGHWESMEHAEESLAALSPLNTGSVPEDTAHAYVYLASEEARFVTGASLYHDGGFGMRY
jgi:NAD(P)-dependent dehydrogenase (short-subunit alcohol dehydrogenase family)